MKNYIVKRLTQTLVIATLFSSAVFAAETNVATLRGQALDQQDKPATIARVINKDVKQARNYPMQPPVIPHKIRNYEINLNSNKCMSCHNRTRTEESQAPMVSVTHYMDRDGNFLAEISPRRYFCNQCHAPQTDAKTLVENDFVDMHSLMKAKHATKN
ncbi:periplasmic nitrate reductase, electron transfer subunit [Thalassotalea insulae]|uniref:Periplasmic nitrate reductase, electron transfer subunit n=1 Tax=Thalassotalea insulae TaxID=2056778 RepID=A0ABQ6GUT2_9GAMM|nr:nitrate reductase cytochrome c-type subunit [Thalassotalea insulae]GLX79647.1 periplasmic nitrate reductase, electron transfer subunit [Thalassotalea insulae]